MNKRARLTSTLVAVTVLLTSGIASAAIEDEQWMAPRDALRMFPATEAPHAVVMEEVLNENTVYSYLFGVTFGKTEAEFERYICSSTQDSNCKNSQMLSYSAIFPTCKAASDSDCVESLAAITSNGAVNNANFVDYASPKHPNNFPADANLNIPQGVTGGLWSIPGTPHAFGDQYAVFVMGSGSVNLSRGPQPSDDFQLTARIIPVSKMKTMKRDTIWGCIQDKTLTPNYKANTRCGPFYEYTDGFRCVSPSGDNNDECLSPHAFPADTRFKLNVRLSKAPVGWLHGRMIDPNINITKTGNAYNVAVEANPAKIPSIFHISDFNKLPANVQDFWMHVDDYCSQQVCGYRSSNNYNAPIPQQTTHLAAINYGAQALEAIKVYLPLIKDTAIVSPSTWSWRTLSTGEMYKANNCFTTGTGVKGIVTTNASAYSAGPPTFIDGQLKYQVAAPHFNPDGSVFKGDYTLVIDSKVARCLYNFSSAPIQATITVVNDKGEQSVATTAVTEKDGWLRLVARNFEFSSPSISVKLEQAKSTEPAPTQVVKPSTPSTPTTTIAKSTQKTISCVKGKTIKKVTGTNPKCPAGYKQK